MKRAAVVTLCLILGVFAGTSFAGKISVFGPNEYERTAGAPNVFTDSFTAISGEGMLIIKNGAIDGNNRIADGLILFRTTRLRLNWRAARGVISSLR